MEHAASMFGVSFRKKPRSGQQDAFNALSTHANALIIKFPTAYGKTFTCAGIYSILKHRGRVNRLLMIVPQVTQFDQFEADAPKDFADAGVSGPLKIVDIMFRGLSAIRDHRENKAQIFLITVQALRERRGMDLVRDLIATGQWMICVDEYHHYGINKSWGEAVLSLSRAFLLAMSATPWRPDDDSAFGPPDVSMTYREACKERSVKPLKGHAYHFRLVVIEGGQEFSYTTKQFAAMAGGDDPERIETLRIEREMRWSPKYVSPLVSMPIERMLRQRVVTHKFLQVLISAMCVSHAEFVCEQLKSMYPELRIAWVGTGNDGRTSEENRRVIAAFCPSLDDDGNRPEPTIDVLVHVGKAGEGLNSIPVSEIVFCNNASICNRRLQEIGRASRYLDGVTANVNFDSSSEFAEKGYIGNALMDAMDYRPPININDDDGNGNTDDVPLNGDPMPEDPIVKIVEVELTHIDSGDEGVQRMARVMAALDPTSVDLRGLQRDPSHPGWQEVVDFYRQMRHVEAAPLREKSELGQLRDNINEALRAITARVLRLKGLKRGDCDSDAIGAIKHAINKRKGQFLGRIDKRVTTDGELLRQHYRWLSALDRELVSTGLPEWLR